MADQKEVDLDSIIDRLLEVRGSRPGKQVQLMEHEIRFLCTKAREIFIQQPILLELEAPIKVSIQTCLLRWQSFLRFLPVFSSISGTAALWRLPSYLGVSLTQHCPCRTDTSTTAPQHDQFNAIKWPAIVSVHALYCFATHHSSAAPNFFSRLPAPMHCYQACHRTARPNLNMAKITTRTVFCREVLAPKLGQSFEIYSNDAGLCWGDSCHPPC